CKDAAVGDQKGRLRGLYLADTGVVDDGSRTKRCQQGPSRRIDAIHNPISARPARLFRINIQDHTGDREGQDCAWSSTRHPCDDMRRHWICQHQQEDDV
ncbi:hypothetical protein BGZ98_003009, partial [Dissophora globulifera]